MSKYITTTMQKDFINKIKALKDIENLEIFVDYRLKSLIVKAITVEDKDYSPYETILEKEWLHLMEDKEYIQDKITYCLATLFARLIEPYISESTEEPYQQYIDNLPKETL